MASILVITVKGVSAAEISKNLSLIDSIMNNKEINKDYTLYSDIKVNPRIYYAPHDVISKDIHDLIVKIRTNKEINSVVKSIMYSQSLNKI